MTIADDLRSLETDVAAEFGQSATLTHVTASVYSPDGSVAQTTTTETVQVDGPVSETSRYAAGGVDESVTATFYVPAEQLDDTVPAKADRLTIGARTWQIVAVETFQVQGQPTSYRLDCSEVAGG